MTRLHFSREQYADGVAKTRAGMEAQSIELLYVSDPPNICWLTGYDGWSYYVHRGVLPALGGEPVCFGCGQDAKGAKHTTYLSEDSVAGYADE